MCKDPPLVKVRKRRTEIEPKQVRPPATAAAAAICPPTARGNDSLIISYNLCRLHDDFAESYVQEEGHDALSWPFLRFKSYGGPFRSEYARLFVHETRYDYGDGNLILLVTMFADNWNEPAFATDHFRQLSVARWQYEKIHGTLSCWDSITQTVVPINMKYKIESAHAEYSCPFPAFPSLIPTELNSYEIILIHEYKGVLLQQVTPEYIMNQTHSTSFVRLNICAYRRPVVDWTWCSNGLQGGRMDYRLIEFVLYQHAIGIDRLVFYDDDGLYLKPLQPFITSGIVHYYRTTRIYTNQIQGYLQDVLMESCRARYWYATRWIGFWDIDEFPVFVKQNDAAYSYEAMTDQNEEATDPIPFDINNYFNNQYYNNNNINNNKKIKYNNNYNNLSLTAPISPPYITSTSLLNQITIQLQNLNINHYYYLIATSFNECIFINNIFPKKQPSVIERFLECNRLHNESKYFFRPAQGHCELSGHQAKCPNYYTFYYKRRDRLFLAHYINAKFIREQPHSSHIHIPVYNVAEIVYYMKHNRTIIHKPLRILKT